MKLCEIPPLRIRIPFFSAVFLALVAVGPGQVFAKGLPLIRDAEIETTIRTYATPLFQAAGLSPSAIDVYLVDDTSLNAFVTPGLRMFIHTGLLMRAETPLQVIGVLAHETGHLAAGHTATRGEAVRASTNAVIASYLIGFAAALASGRSELASAAIAGGQDIALKNVLSYSRSQESAADQYAINLLEGTGQSPRGLLEFMRLLEGQEVLLSSRQDPYLRTHPLTGDRVTFLENQVRKSPSADRPAGARLEMLHARMRAKLIGFLQPRQRVLRTYPESDTSLPARYARAIATFRAGETDRALDLIDGLIAERPDDPFFHELKGQVLFENGHIARAVEAYREASRLLPESPQIRLALAQALIELNDRRQDAAALEHLQVALREEPSNAFAWRLSAVANGRRGDVGLTALALAEAAVVRGRNEEALEQATRAQGILVRGSPAWLRAQDIQSLARRKLDK